MNRKLIIFSLTATMMIFSAAIHGQAQESNKIKFSLDDSTNVIKQEEDTPELRQGERLVVEIINVYEAQPSWSFTFDTLTLRQIPPQNSDILRFESAKISASMSGNIQLRFTDSAGEVSLANDIFVSVTNSQDRSGKQAVSGPPVRLKKCIIVGKTRLISISMRMACCINATFPAI